MPPVKHLSGALTWVAVLAWIAMSVVAAMLAARLLGLENQATLDFLSSASGDVVLVAVMVVVLAAALLILAGLEAVWSRALAKSSRLPGRSRRRRP